MMLDALAGIPALVRAAARRSMLSAAERQGGPELDRSAIESLVPHRDPFLLIDRITRVYRDEALIVCRYDLARAAAVFAGHFPDEPVWPGVLQVEAVGQAGVCLHRLLRGGRGTRSLALTDILGAHFVRRIVPGSMVEIVTHMVSDGLFTVFVGQCLQADQVCSAAAVRGIEKEGQA